MNSNTNFPDNKNDRAVNDIPLDENLVNSYIQILEANTTEELSKIGGISDIIKYRLNEEIEAARKILQKRNATIPEHFSHSFRQTMRLIQQMRNERDIQGLIELGKHKNTSKTLRGYILEIINEIRINQGKSRIKNLTFGDIDEKLTGWIETIAGGIISGIISAIAIKETGGIGFGVWIICYYILVIMRVERRYVAIAIMLIVGFYGPNFIASLSNSGDEYPDINIIVKNIKHGSEIRIDIELQNNGSEQFIYDRIQGTFYIYRADEYGLKSFENERGLIQGERISYEFESINNLGFLKLADRRFSVSVYKDENVIKKKLVEIPKRY